MSRYPAIVDAAPSFELSLHDMALSFLAQNTLIHGVHDGSRAVTAAINAADAQAHVDTLVTSTSPRPNGR